MNMKHRARRGAARINVIWMIVVAVFALVAIAFAIAQNEEAARQAEAAQQARQAQQTSVTNEEEMLTRARTISNVLGFTDPDVVGSLADPALASEGLADLRQTFPLDESIETYEGAIPELRSAFELKLSEIQTLSGQIADLRGQVEAAQEALNNVRNEKDAEIRDLTQRLSDAEANARDEIANLETRFAQVRSDRQETDSLLREARGEIDDLQRQREKEHTEFTTRTTHLASVLKFTREPEEPDGEVLEVSRDLGVGWIDVGAKHRLSRGMQFRVVSGMPGSDRLKGFASVINVKEDMAEVSFYDLVDRFDPIVPGDLVYNPLYDPTGERNAVLIGRFSGTYNEKELQMLMDEINVNVQPEITNRTDYLIVGSELYTDEFGEPLDEPIQPSDLPAYKQAEAIGVVIVPIRDVRRYFKK